MSNPSNRTTLLIIGGLVLAGLIWIQVDSGSLEMKDVSLMEERPARDRDSIRELPIEWDRAVMGRAKDAKARPLPSQPLASLPPGWHDNPFATRPTQAEISSDSVFTRTIVEQNNSQNSSLSNGGEVCVDERRQGDAARGSARRIFDQEGDPVQAEAQSIKQIMLDVPATHVIAPPTNRLLAMLQRGESLARRGATATAEQEFTQVLTLIAQHNDAVRGETSSSAALSRAMQAIEEAEDFVASKNRMAIDVAQQVLRHQTRAISAQQAQGMTALGAAQIYYSYARKMFRDAFQHDPIASRALFCLAKLHSYTTLEQTDSAANHAKVMLLHYAALDCDPQNFPSANELGVMLAKGGRLVEARDCLAHSVSVQATISGLQNLAHVQTLMGDVQGSEMTMARAQALDQGKAPGIVNEQIVLVDQRSFNAIPNRSGDFYVRQDVPPETASPASDKTTKSKRWFMWR